MNMALPLIPEQLPCLPVFELFKSQSYKHTVTCYVTQLSNMRLANITQVTSVPADWTVHNMLQ
jgi:hypothetical protein